MFSISVYESNPVSSGTYVISVLSLPRLLTCNPAISCFDEQLLEDRTVNRLEDSLNLWKNVCSNPILQHATLIVFLNKYDILKRKLKSGILMSKYMTSFGDRPNEPHVVAGCMIVIIIIAVFAPNFLSRSQDKVQKNLRRIWPKQKKRRSIHPKQKYISIFDFSDGKPTNSFHHCILDLLTQEAKKTASMLQTGKYSQIYTFALHLPSMPISARQYPSASPKKCRLHVNKAFECGLNE